MQLDCGSFQKKERDQRVLTETWSKSLGSQLRMFAKTKRFLSRASRLRALETAFGLLKDLSPDQVKTFDAVVRRRPLFYGGKKNRRGGDKDGRSELK